LLRADVRPLLGVDAAHMYPALLALIVVKGVIWAVALGSGTSGGVLAPLLILGGSLGALAAPWLPGGDAPLWALVSVASILAARCARR
jgi:H+/Cl- antiporter ClcA